MITLQFSTKTSLSSRLIRWATWSAFSHVDLVLPDGRLLGATARRGVSIRNPEPVARLVRFTIDAPSAVIDVASTQLGRPYDWSGILGWGLRRDWQEDDSWFCSELIAWAFDAAGCPLLRARNSWRITPRDLLLSPLLGGYNSNGELVI